MLDHWMKATVGMDFRANVGTKAPVGLVSEPADYPECERAAKRVIPRTYTGKLKLSDAEVSKKCHQLYQTIKEQTLSYLLSVAWSVIEGSEAGIKLSDAELHREFARFRKQYYGSPGGERAFLAERQMVAADAMYQLKRNILVRRLRPKFEAEVKKAGGGEKAYASVALKHYNGLIARTTCQKGYVVQGCRGYQEPAVALPSASVILGGFAGAGG